MQKIYLPWILFFVSLNIGFLYAHNFIVSLFFSLLIILTFVYVIWREQKHEQENQRLVKELERNKSLELFLQQKTIEMDRTRVAMASMTKDVLAERDRVEKQMAKDEAILSSVGESMLAVSLDGNLVFINPAAQRLLEMKEEELLGKFIDQVFVIYDESMQIIPHEKQPVVETLKTAAPVNKTVMYTGIDGLKRSLKITSTPIKQKDVLIGAICIIRDITKEKEIDRMKTEFISLASHQLRTPLSAIKWFGEMLIGGDAGQLNGEQKQFATNIYDSTIRMIDLVSSLLNISRIESGRIIVDPKPTDLKQLVESIAVELKVKFDEKQQKFSINLPEGLPLINIDPRLIRQVYLNLLTNAIKYSPKGTAIAVVISRKDKTILSQISDNGYGIPVVEQSKVFQKFFRAENITKIVTDGTGLGLYLIKSIIDSSGGKIWFQSAEGKGTSFFFSLPEDGMKAKTGEVTLD